MTASPRGTLRTSPLDETTMDPSALPFDADAMLDGLRTWVECESPTWDTAAVNRMMDIASRELVIAGARIERVAGRMGFGDCVRATFPHPTLNVPGIVGLGVACALCQNEMASEVSRLTALRERLREGIRRVCGRTSQRRCSRNHFKSSDRENAASRRKSAGPVGCGLWR